MLGTSAAAVGVALAGADREEANAFLRKQAALTDRLMEELKEENPLKLSHLRLRRISDLGRIAFQASLGFLAMALVVAVGAMVWNAAHSDGLIIESFSVPPDLAEKGLTGQVVASQLLDAITTIQKDTRSVRPSRSYANNWGDDIKVDIPETGVSIGEAYRFLRGWLGHETHVSGEAYRTEAGIAITVRIGAEAGATFTGAEANRDALVQQAAEHIYRVTQPDRYARYLIIPERGVPQRFEEARAILNQMIAEAPPVQKGWAWNGIGIIELIQGNPRGARLAYQRALALNSTFTILYSNLATAERYLGHFEAALTAAQTSARVTSRTSVPDISPDYLPRIRLQNEMVIALSQGDYAGGFTTGQNGAKEPPVGLATGQEFFSGGALISMAGMHDASGVRTYLAELPAPEAPQRIASRALSQFLADAKLENWRSVITAGPKLEKFWNGVKFLPVQDIIANQIRPALALANARLGDIAGASALIATTPVDCYDCIRTRGLIAQAAKQPGRADYWFSRAVNDGPSLPFAYTDWGQALLARGQPDAAIAKLKVANQKGPKFADPIVYWGEALMVKNQSHLALAKFAEAEKFAPNWGRLHLKWGEALIYAGKPDQAKKQFARARDLHLTASEKSQLARISR